MSSRRLPLLTLMALPACAGGAPTMPMPTPFSSKSFTPFG